MSLTVEQIRDVLREKNPASLVSAEHSDEGHFYRYAPSNRLFASVTTKCGILDAPHLKKWAARLAVQHFVTNVTVDMVEQKVMSPDFTAVSKLMDESILVHQDQFEEAGDIGTRGHKFIEDYLLEWMKTGVRPSDIRTFVTDPDARCMAIARSAEMFCHDFDVIPIASEMFVASDRHEFAGTLDSLMMVMKVTKKGSGVCGKHHAWWLSSTSNPNKRMCKDCGAKGEYKFAIVDWKTSNSIDKVEYAMQVAAYWQAIYEMTGLRPQECYIVRLDKGQAKYEVRRLRHRPSAFRAFAHTAKVWDWLNDGTEKLVAANPKKSVSLKDIKFNEA